MTAIFTPFLSLNGCAGISFEIPKPLEITDLGAGSKVTPRKQRTVSNIARHGAIDARTGQMLFRLVNWRKPSIVLELGTSLGISTMYQASAALSARVITIEGCPSTARTALQNFEAAGLSGIELINRSFDEGLDLVLADVDRIDYLFLDGDHRAGASIRYFEPSTPLPSQ